MPLVPVAYAKKLMTFKERRGEQDKETATVSRNSRQDRFLRWHDRAGQHCKYSSNTNLEKQN